MYARNQTWRCNFIRSAPPTPLESAVTCHTKSHSTSENPQAGCFKQTRLLNKNVLEWACRLPWRAHSETTYTKQEASKLSSIKIYMLHQGWWKLHNIDNLSGGQRQRVIIARAILQNGQCQSPLPTTQENCAAYYLHPVPVKYAVSDTPLFRGSSFFGVGMCIQLVPSKHRDPKRSSSARNGGGICYSIVCSNRCSQQYWVA